jgi:hypothetical protein
MTCEISDEILYLKKKAEPVLKLAEIVPPIKINDCIEFDTDITNDYYKTRYVELDKSYFNFIKDAVFTDSSDGSLIDVKEIDVKDVFEQGVEEINIKTEINEKGLKNVKVNYISADNRIDLVKKLYNSKKAIEPSTNGTKLEANTTKTIEFFYLKGSICLAPSSTPQPASKKNLKDIEFYITSFLDSQKADFSSTVTAYNIGFLKNRDSKILDYTLQNYGLLIEKEFDTLDYSLMLATHLNLSLKEKSNFLKPEEYKIMKEWNFCKIKYSNSKKCLFKLLKKFGLSLEVIRMIDILYNKGILTSKDIIEAFKENAEEQLIT